MALVALLGLGCGSRADADSDREPVPRAELQLAQGALRAGRPEVAQARYEELLAAYPQSWAAARGLQDTLRSRLPPEAFEARYAEARAQAPADALSVYLYGRSRIQSPAIALSAFEEAARLAPSNPWPPAGIAYLHWATGDLFLTVQSYEDALERMPRSATLRYLLGNQLLTLKLVVDAERHLAIANRLRPNDPLIEAALGKVYVELDRGEGRQLLESALAADPGMADVAMSLASVALRDRDPERAEQLYRQALEGGLPADQDLYGAIRAAKLVEGAR